MDSFMPSDTSSYVEHPIEPNKCLKVVSNTVDDNLKYFSEPMKKRASKVRKACIVAGTPNFSSFKAAMRINIIKNDTVTTEDTDHM